MIEKSSHPAPRWAYRSAGELTQSLLKKEISALELTDQFIAPIEALDGDLNAVPVRDFAARVKLREQRTRRLSAARAAPGRAGHNHHVAGCRPRGDSPRSRISLPTQTLPP